MGVIDDLDQVRVRVPDSLGEYLAAPRHDVADAAQAEMAGLARAYLDGDPGLFVLTDLPTDNRAELAVALVSDLLGTAIGQDREGTIIRQVRDRGLVFGDGPRVRYSDSRTGGDLHTDGAERPLPAPALFTLFCVRQSEDGGDLEFVRLEALLAELDSRPDVIDTLREPFHFDRRGDHLPGEAPTTTKPVLFEQGGRAAVTYLRSYIDCGHQQGEAPALSGAQTEALDLVDQILASGRVTCQGKLREGELAVVDNLRVLHGRTEFHDTPGHDRLLLRTWVARGEAHR
jgi:hypothetical protein